MKTLLIAVAVLVALGFALFGIALPAQAQEAPEAPCAQSLEKKAERVAVVFERSVRNREVLELVVQEALRDAGYAPVVATGVRRLSSERNWKRLPEGTKKVIIVSDARVITRRQNETSPLIAIGKSGRTGARVRWQKITATLDLKMANVDDRALVGFGHGSGEASNLQRISVGGVYRQQRREDMVYEAAKQAAAEAVKGLR